MAKSTVPSTPADYLAALPEPRQSELKALDRAIRKAVPQLKPYVASGGAMLGYGRFAYRYDSGREGECPLVALSSRAQAISLYIMGNRKGKTLVEAAAKRLGKVSAGKACIRFKRLEDLDLAVALELIRDSATLLGTGRADFSLDP